MLLQQSTEVEYGGFVGNASLVQSVKLPQDGGLVQCFLRHRIAVADQFYIRCTSLAICRTTTFALRVMRPDQRNQTLPGHHLNHLDQKQLFAGLLTLAGVFGMGEGQLLHRKTRQVESRHFGKIGKSSSGFP